MAGIIISGTDETVAYELAGAMARKSAPLLQAGLQVFGPAAAPIARIRGRHRVRLLIKGPKGAALQAPIRAWVGQFKAPSNTRITIDIDPQSFY